MCHFINATLPRHANVDAVRKLALRHSRAWTEITSGRVKRLLPRGETYHNTTPGICDCGTPLGSAPGLDIAEAVDRGTVQCLPVEPDWSAPEARRLLRKGWSRAKIRRALAQRSAHASHIGDLHRMDARDRIPHVLPWMEFLSDVLGSDATDRLGILLIWSEYQGGAPIERRHIERTDLTPEVLLAIEENIIYEFSA